MSQAVLTIDGLQYSNWSRTIFEEMREGGVDAVHATLVYHENCRETLLRFGEWQRRFEAHAEGGLGGLRPRPPLSHPRSTRDDGPSWWTRRDFGRFGSNSYVSTWPMTGGR